MEGPQEKDRGYYKLVPESQLVHDCLTWLQACGVLAWRNNTGALKPGKGRFLRFGHPGSGDIFAVDKGHFYSIECKRPGKKPTTLQGNWADAVSRAGGTAWVIHTLSELEQLWRSR